MSPLQIVILKHVNFLKSTPQTVHRYLNYSVFMSRKGDCYLEAHDQSFHMLFLKDRGFTAKWGRTLEDDPDFNPFGNEIADIEITKCCRGIRDKAGQRHPCPFCYKGNGPDNAHYMSLETFKTIFDKLNEAHTMTQIAFGVDAEASDELNPDIWEIFEYTKRNGVTPNVTVADIDQDTAEKIVSYCGATAVSAYQANKERCYDSVKLLIDEAAKQGKNNYTVNIHALVSEETYEFLFELLHDVETDERLKGLNAVVFLSLKQKGRGVHFNKIDEDKFKKLIDYCFEHNIGFGMDSCSANKFLRAIEGRENVEELKTYVEPCEKLLYSLYINADGKLFPCSFMEHEGDWKEGIDMTKIDNFYKDVWMNPIVVKDREASVKCIHCHGCNTCAHYDV